MIIQTGREKDEIIVETVKNGVVQEVTEYKYLGIWVNKDGNCMLQIEKKKEQVKGQVSALISLASYYNVGPLYVMMRLKLYELCIVPSILYNLEGWNRLTKKEIEKLETIQHRTLCTLLQLPKTTPYIGLLSELGMWRMEERMMYRKIMLFHNIMNSSDKRLCKQIIQEQIENEEEETFYVETKMYCNKLRINIKELQAMQKSEVKRIVKAKIAERMVGVIHKSLHMTKLRFICKPTKLEVKKYIEILPGTESLKTLKTRLNMQPVYGNYKGDISKQRLCQYCNKADDTTEHLLCCKTFGTEIAVDNLKNEDNAEVWRQINQLVDFNLKHRLECV